MKMDLHQLGNLINIYLSTHNVEPAKPRMLKKYKVQTDLYKTRRYMCIYIYTHIYPLYVIQNMAKKICNKLCKKDDSGLHIGLLKWT